MGSSSPTVYRYALMIMQLRAFLLPQNNRQPNGFPSRPKKRVPLNKRNDKLPDKLLPFQRSAF